MALYPSIRPVKNKKSKDKMMSTWDKSSYFNDFWMFLKF